MAVDLGFLVIETQELQEGVDRMRDVELADLISTVFGAWSFVISVALGMTPTGFIGGILPSIFITCTSGMNVYREQHDRDGFEFMNHVSLIAGLWMFMSAMQFPDNILMQYSNTFAGMWVGLFSTYAAFLRQNAPDRETVVGIRADAILG